LQFFSDCRAENANLSRAWLLQSARRMKPILVLCSSAALAGCFSFPDTDGSSSSSGTYDDPFVKDSAEYDALVADLERNRTPFLGEEADELAAAKQRVYWLEFPGFDPSLHSYAGGARVDYAFSIGTGDEYNFRASTDVVVSAAHESDQVVYRAYAASGSMQPLGATNFASPGDEQRWYAYAVDGNTVYIVLSNAPSMNGTTLMRWTPGSSPVPVTTLESAGIEVGEFWDFGVEGNTMLLIEDGRLWRLDLSTNQAEWLQNETEISGNVNFEPDGVLFEAATGAFFYRTDTRELLDIGLTISESPYAINESFASSHLYQEGLTRWGDHAIYVGQSGIFSLHLGTHDINPLLLEPRTDSPRVEYRYPVALESGTLYTTGLTSESGSVGADGPVYALELSALLP
jgi:hypothetical protein